ncbi:ribonuclease III [Melittangium boletus]|uniref:Ribonuclease 3 n=1 Tax=Melittangium boletus DSM 14713 TaxID=1294270 RepID=A0A250IQX8_9BACT|nr:ribonuclease III [Melittangium boletus]ATB33688.1 ribonuclease III [Melittangium boletus DSM 14713]
MTGQQAERVKTLEARLGASFPRPELALTALTHKSWINEHRSEGAQDNERLEFLGDAVINLAVGHRLMERFPQMKEGELTPLRARIVNEEGLSRIARRLGLGELLLLGRGEELSGGRDKHSLLANALEAVFAAVYLGEGLGPVMALVDRHFAEALEGVAQALSRQDYKTKLQESAQERLKLTPRYRTVSETGPDHEKIFEVQVLLGEEVYATATGRSKKDAEQMAARTALDEWHKRIEKPEAVISPASPSPKEDPPG